MSNQPSTEDFWSMPPKDERIEVVRFDGFEFEVVVDSKTVRIGDRRREDLRWTKPPCKKT